MTSLLIKIIGHLCLAACLSEMAGTLPFSGGIYGFVRAFVGPFTGYVVSRFEIIQNISYLTSTVMLLASFPTTADLTPKSLEPLWWVVLFTSAVSIALVGCNYRAYWGFIQVMGGLSLLLLVIYICGSMQYVNYDKNVDGDSKFEAGHFFRYVHHTAGMFRGIQYSLLSWCCTDCFPFIC